MVRLSSFILCLVVLNACQVPRASETETITDIISDKAKSRIDSTLESMVENERIAGVSALIFEKNKEVYFNAFGMADRESNIPMDRNTIVRIYSMTKPVTGVALMKLYEQGLFDLDDPLSKYAPEFTNMKVFEDIDKNGKFVFVEPRRPITIRDITRHTAGFARNEHPDIGALVRQVDPMNPNNTLAEMATKLASLPLMAHPGEQWIYGPSVDVQAYLVEKLSGKPFDQFLRENIFDPLGMNSTGYVVDKSALNHLAAMYQRTDTSGLVRLPDEINGFNTREWPMKPGGYGLTSTLDDYMRFTQMLVNEGTLDGVTILKPETIKLMATNQLDENVTEQMWLPTKGSVGFGIDFAVRYSPPASPEENHGIVGEFFWDGAASTLFWVDPVNELTAVLFVQVFPFDRELHKKFRDAVYGKYKPQPM